MEEIKPDNVNHPAHYEIIEKADWYLKNYIRLMGGNKRCMNMGCD